MSTLYNTSPNSQSALLQYRIEPRSRVASMGETIGAQVHDALWMLTQQWRVGEYKGTDGGSVMKAKLRMKSEKIGKYQLLNQSAQDFDDSMPLNTAVEALDYEPDLLMRLQIGKHWALLLNKHIGNNTYNGDYSAQPGLQIEAPATTEYANLSDKQAAVLLTVAGGQMLDGYKLYQDVKATPGNAKAYAHDSAKDAEIDLAESDFIKYVEKLVYKPTEEAWEKSALEYQYKVSSYDGSDETVMVGDHAQSGKLQWYDVDLDADASTLSNTNDQTTFYQEEYLPGSADFHGMPTGRWWEFEDRNIDLATMLTNKNDLSKLMVMEFGLIYSNDWFVIPRTLQAGTLNSIDTLVVTDVFGKHTKVNPAGTGIDDVWQRWSMYTLNKRGNNADAADNRLYLPPTFGQHQEGQPIEQVYLVRDEMANMVWGLEEVVPSPVYGGVRGNIALTELEEYFKANSIYTPVPAHGEEENDAEVKYTLMNTVPENWIPFIPVKVGSSSRDIQYQRAKMNRVFEGFTTSDFVTPRTDLLSYGLDATPDPLPYYINEEEITRPGVVIKTNYQRTRWYNGEIFTWVGRNKVNGRGEATSGLEYDVLSDIE